MQVYTKDSGKNEFRHFLDNQQYQTNGILRYERIFGQGYVSTGGFETTKVCFATVPAVCAVLLAVVFCTASSAPCVCYGFCCVCWARAVHFVCAVLRVMPVTIAQKT